MLYKPLECAGDNGSHNMLVVVVASGAGLVHSVKVLKEAVSVLVEAKSFYSGFYIAVKAVKVQEEALRMAVAGSRDCVCSTVAMTVHVNREL